MQFEEAMVALKEAHCEGTKRGEQLDTEVGQSFAECFLEFLQGCFLEEGELSLDGDVVDEVDLHEEIGTNGSMLLPSKYMWTLERVS